MTVADTTVLVALVDRGHPQHAHAQRALSSGPIAVTRGTLAELATVVRRRAKDSGADGNRAARTALAAVTGLPSFTEAVPVPLEAVLALHSGNPRLSFVDAWNLACALASGETLVTYDRHLRLAWRRQASP